MDGDLVAVIPPPSKALWAAAALWSRNDGLVAGTICRHDTTPAVEARSSHLWVQNRPQVLAAVATILAGWPPPSVSDQ